MRSLDLTIIVNSPTPLTVAATVHVSDDLIQPEIVAVAMPGGGYNRHYFDLQIEGHAGYSQAEFHTARGWVFIACDTIGTGESSRTETPQSISEIGRIQGDVVHRLRELVKNGSLVDGVKPTARARFIGLGQSMGGCFTIAAQGSCAPYDAVGILGFSAQRTNMPLPDGGFLDLPLNEDGTPASPEVVAVACAPLFRSAFHWEEEPAIIVESDIASLPFRQGEDLPKWGIDAAPQPCAVDMMVPGVVAREAASITCPILIAQGVRDLVPDPRSEPSAYTSATDITVLVQPRMAHMHNFAPTRREFWRRIHDWGSSVV